MTAPSQPRKPVPPKEDRKTVQVPYPTSNSGVALTAPVTLKKAPWEKGE